MVLAVGSGFGKVCVVGGGFWSWQRASGVSILARFRWIVVVCWIFEVDCGCLVDFYEFEWVLGLAIVGLCLCFPICYRQ